MPSRSIATGLQLGGFLLWAMVREFNAAETSAAIHRSRESRAPLLAVGSRKTARRTVICAVRISAAEARQSGRFELLTLDYFGKQVRHDSRGPGFRVVRPLK